MSGLLPGLLAGAAVAVLLGLPLPRRAVLATAADRRLPRPSAPVVAALVGAALLVPLGAPGAAVAALLAFLGLRGWEARRKGVAAKAERDSAAEAMVVLAAELRAGRPAPVALARAGEVATGPTGVALREAAVSTGLGGAPGEVLLRHAPGSAVPELLRGLAVCWQVCHGAGSSLAVAVDRLEQGLRAERLCSDEVEAELAGPRATALTLAVLPVFGLLLGTGIGARPLDVLLHSTVGAVCLVLGVALDLAGLWWTGRILARAGGSR